MTKEIVFMTINDDGFVEGQKFSKVDLPYPFPVDGETFREYRKRVDELVAKGFHLGDLTWSDWKYYCMGSGQYEGANADEVIIK